MVSVVSHDSGLGTAIRYRTSIKTGTPGVELENSLKAVLQLPCMVILTSLSPCSLRQRLQSTLPALWVVQLEKSTNEGYSSLTKQVDISQAIQECLGLGHP